MEREIEENIYKRFPSLGTSPEKSSGRYESLIKQRLAAVNAVSNM